MHKKFKKVLSFFLIPILLISLITYFKIENIPTTIFVREGENVKNNNFIKLTEECNSKNVNSDIKSYNKKLDVKILGVLPVKSVDLKSVSKNITVYPGGRPIGVKLNTKGALVIALSDIEGKDGKTQSPAALNGVEIGDSIVRINDREVNNSEDVEKQVGSCDGKEIKITLYRKGKKIVKGVKPIQSKKDNRYKIGLWVRDSTAGVGTLTFYHNKTGKFAALGHPITDVDTGTILTIDSGEIVPSSIVSVKKGIKGSPGELKGIFLDEDLILGQIQNNTECGIFGTCNLKMDNKIYKKPMEVALRNEIKEGPAQVLTTLEGEEPKLYNIEIQKLLSQDKPGPKSMIIKVTDEKLMKKTGGIVQGMSGSPIIQNNKIVGAVTHVLINRPDVGYGIYIEWMLKDAGLLQNN
ncbi:SpoIVB peptidase [Clostridium niameyense]|uniref:SpoIVB peptidase n=1 Tax=Clostridium niameyense TaxID=1622073 RepID=A0A6M0R7X4_9CLOT|nr:SpoIVB peptidase [Clostridium niameyense]NEZ46294.1 SpoIVB peptidase [Clostridium niameyense]